MQKVKGYLYRPSPRHCHVDEGIHIPWKDNIPTNAYSVLTFERDVYTGLTREDIKSMLPVCISNKFIGFPWFVSSIIPL